MGNKILLLLVAIMLTLSTIAFAEDDVDSINMVIRAKSGRWVAGETPLSRMSFEEKQMRVRLHKPTSIDGPAVTLSQDVELAASLDWRNNNGNFVTGVRDQRNCGSCWAFAAAATLESSTNIAKSTPGYDLDLAEQILVSCSGAGSCNGGSVSGAANYVRDTGLPLETIYPYAATNGACSNATPGWNLSDYRIKSWFYVSTSSPTVEGLKAALTTYGPLATTMAVYNDFFSYRSGVYAYATGSLAGYHAVQIVAYDDVGQYFTVKNSWGKSWGEAGFFRIAYSELNSVTQFGDYTIAYVNSNPAPAPDPTPTPCSFTVSPTSAAIQATGGTGTITVTASAATCAWTASSSVLWITVGAGTTGSGSVSYTVGPNTTTRAKTGTIKVAGQTVSFSQKAPPKAVKPQRGR
jgi:C1A family cysteine protease